MQHVDSTEKLQITAATALVAASAASSSTTSAATVQLLAAANASYDWKIYGPRGLHDTRPFPQLQDYTGQYTNQRLHTKTFIFCFFLILLNNFSRTISFRTLNIVHTGAHKRVSLLCRLRGFTLAGDLDTFYLCFRVRAQKPTERIGVKRFYVFYSRLLRVILKLSLSACSSPKTKCKIFVHMVREVVWFPAEKNY